LAEIMLQPRPYRWCPRQFRPLGQPTCSSVRNRGPLTHQFSESAAPDPSRPNRWGKPIDEAGANILA